jgi:hypothetical protein
LTILKAITFSICAAFLLRATGHAAELAEDTAFASPKFVATPATPTPDFESLRIKGLILALPGPQDTIDPDFAGIRSSLAALGIGYIGYNYNNFWDNMLPAERTTFGQQVYNGQKPTFFTNNVMQMTYDLSRYGISDGQIVVGGIYNFDTWEPGGPNALPISGRCCFAGRPTRAYRQFFDNRSILCTYCAWHSRGHRARVHEQSHAGELYAADRECPQLVGQRGHVLVRPTHACW